MLPMPDLADLVGIDLSRPGVIWVTTRSDREDRCDDEGCTEPHRMIPGTRSRMVEASPEHFRQLADHFASLGKQ